MEFLQAIGTSIISTIVEDLVKSIGRHVGYICRFKSIIEDLNEEIGNLRSKLERMQHRVDRAKEYTEEIEEDVQKWLREVGDIVADVQNLEKESREKQTCLNGWCPNWMWKYQLAKKAEKRKNIVLKFIESEKFDIISHPATLPGVNVFSSKDFIPFESNQRSFNKIIEALKDDKTTVVGLYGMGGVGKTTLAKDVVNKSKEENIFNKVVMVVVSQTPNIKGIQGQIADFLNLKLHEESIEGRAERLSMRLKNEKKILIILDDIWAKLDLTIIGIHMDDHHKDCKIFLTTRREQVCIDMRCQIRIPLDVLNKEEGLLLLKRQVGLNDDFPTLIPLANEVANECKGLPLAIVAVGNALKEKTIDEWKLMIQKLKKSKLIDVDVVDVDVYACLKLSYEYLKNEKTKFCFLLCSLFPEDYEIDMEELLRYGLGLGLYEDTDSIEDARTELRVMVNHLKASSLLLEANEGFVKMHDVVRDVALWIASKGEYVFMVKAGMGLTEWPNHQGLEQCTAISVIENEIKVLPDDLVCPKLLILLLGSYSDLNYRSEISENSFEEMKVLKVMTLVRRKLSLKSLQSLTNLVTLQLIDCELRGISSLTKLAKLEVLSLQNSVVDESLEELKELSKLRMLDLRCCYLERIPVDVIPKLSRLEQLYIISERSKEQEIEGTSVGRSNASLFELNKLDRLTILYLRITVPQHLPKDFILLKKLLKCDIRVNDEESRESYPKSRRLTITDVEGTSLFAFKALYENVEDLKLKKIMGCYQNIVPSIDETGLNELKMLSLRDIQEVECIIDMTQQHVPFTAFSNLVRLGLYDLRNLRNIWKGPTQQVSLQNLTVVVVSLCHKLKYVFTLNLARSLLQLQQLFVTNCYSLEHIVEIKAEENAGAGGGNDLLLPNLRILKLQRVEKLINFCSENYTSTWPALQELVLSQTLSLAAELGANMQTAKKTLRWLCIMDGSDKFCNVALSQLKKNFENLEYLRISYCRGVQVIFQLEQRFCLPSLKQLKLQHLEVEWLYKGPTHLLSLPNLQLLRLCDCRRLRHLLSSTLAPNLLQLETIDISDCGELEQLMDEDDREDHVQLPLFPNLSSIHVQWCQKLKTLFPVTIARLDLQKLTSLYVRGSSQLKEIFGHKDEADTTHLEIVLPQLKRLTLDGLESLANFCPSGYRLIFPSLSWLRVTSCPKITTRFSVDQTGSVHAQAEVEHFPPETDRAVLCEGTDDIQRKLPPYIGK